jgi:hypothetical protein
LAEKDHRKDASLKEIVGNTFSLENLIKHGAGCYDEKISENDLE